MYAPSMLCVWVFPSEYPVRLRFDILDTEQAFDSVSVYEASADSALLGKLSVPDWLNDAEAQQALRLRISGPIRPTQTLTAGGNGLWIVISFRSDASVENGTGFAMTYCVLPSQTAAPTSVNETETPTQTGAPTLAHTAAPTTVAPTAFSPYRETPNSFTFLFNAADRSCPRFSLNALHENGTIRMIRGYMPKSKCSWVFDVPPIISLGLSMLATEQGHDFIRIYRLSEGAGAMFQEPSSGSAVLLASFSGSDSVDGSVPWRTIRGADQEQLTPAPVNLLQCADYHVECSAWAFARMCYGDGAAADYVRVTCAASCKLCDHS